MSDKHEVAQLSSVSDAGAGVSRGSSGSRARTHCRKWWWAYLVAFVVVVLVVVLPV